MANEKADVVIVGAGASGSVFAAVLAKAGRKVVVLEAGPDWKLSDLVSSEMWGRRIRPAGAPIVLEGKNPFGYAGQAGWGVGGAQLHYFANHPRLLENDFKMKSEHNRALDWPISYQDVAPFYDKVARDIGMSGDAKAEETWRPAGEPYPMPPMKTFRHGEIWVKGFESLGIRMAPAPVAINSTDYKGRPACMHDGWCAAGCPIGALANPHATYLGEARKVNAEVRALCTVTRVLTDPQGSKVVGVEYYDEKKQRQVQEASVVVLAAWPGQIPRIMLNSATDKHPNGLANASGLVGKYLMAHTIAGTAALFDEDIQNHLGTIGAQFMSYDRYGKTSYKGAFGSSYIACGAAQKTHDFANSRPDLFGAELHAFMKRAARGFTRISIFGEELPNPRTGSSSRAKRTSSACRSPALFTATIRMRSRCGTQTSRRARRRPRRPAPRRPGRGVRSRRATCSAAPSWARERPTRWSTATARPTSCPTSTWPGWHLPDRRRPEPDLLDPRPVAARRRAPRRQVGLGGGLIPRPFRCRRPGLTGRPSNPGPAKGHEGGRCPCVVRTDDGGAPPYWSCPAENLVVTGSPGQSPDQVRGGR